MTLSTAIDTFGRDATRLALADAGDGTDDANFTEETANAAILRIYTQLEWTKEVMEQLDTFRDESPLTSFADLWFNNEINALVREANQHYKKYVVPIDATTLVRASSSMQRGGSCRRHRRCCCRRRRRRRSS